MREVIDLECKLLMAKQHSMAINCGEIHMELIIHLLLIL